MTGDDYDLTIVLPAGVDPTRVRLMQSDLAGHQVLVFNEEAMRRMQESRDRRLMPVDTSALWGMRLFDVEARDAD